MLTGVDQSGLAASAAFVLPRYSPETQAALAQVGLCEGLRGVEVERETRKQHLFAAGKCSVRAEKAGGEEERQKDRKKEKERGNEREKESEPEIKRKKGRDREKCITKRHLNMKGKAGLGHPSMLLMITIRNLFARLCKAFGVDFPVNETRFRGFSSLNSAY